MTKKFFLYAVLAMLLAGCCSCQKQKQEVQLSGRFVHHVLFWLVEPDNPKACTEFEGALRDLVSIDLIVANNIGVPAATNREVIENSYTYSMVVTFKNKADQDAYQIHPDHLKFIEKYGHLWNRVMVIDTESIVN